MNSKELTNEQLISLLIKSVPEAKLQKRYRYQYGRSTPSIPKNISDVDFTSLCNKDIDLKDIIKNNELFQQLCLVKIDGLANKFIKLVYNLNNFHKKKELKLKQEQEAREKLQKQKAQKAKRQAEEKKKRIEEQEILRLHRLMVRKNLRDKNKAKLETKQRIIKKIGLSAEQKELLKELL